MSFLSGVTVFLARITDFKTFFLSNPALSAYIRSTCARVACSTRNIGVKSANTEDVNIEDTSTKGIGIKSAYTKDINTENVSTKGVCINSICGTSTCTGSICNNNANIVKCFEIYLQFF